DTAVAKTFIGTVSDGNTSTYRYEAEASRQQTHYGRVIKDAVQFDVDSTTGYIVGTARRQFAEQSLDRPFILAYRFSDFRNVNDKLLSLAGRELPVSVGVTYNSLKWEASTCSGFPCGNYTGGWRKSTLFGEAPSFFQDGTGWNVYWIDGAGTKHRYKTTGIS